MYEKLMNPLFNKTNIRYFKSVIIAYLAKKLNDEKAIALFTISFFH